jgi:hypothetical protein
MIMDWLVVGWLLALVVVVVVSFSLLMISTCQLQKLS